MSTTCTDRSFTFDVPAIPESDWIAMKNYRRLRPCRSRSTLDHWMSHGLVSRGGDVVRLPSFRIGGRRYTTQAAFDWWNRELDR